MLPAFRRVGSGPLLVCHPGGPGFSSAEFGDLAGLGEEFTLILVDPRGTGETGPAESYHLDDYAADLEELRAHLGEEKLDLFGFSHGGIVAMAYAAARPGRVRRLVAASTLAAFGPELEAEAERFKASKAGEPWHADATAALAEEDRGEGELPDLWPRMAPMYFSRWDERYRPYVERSTEGAARAPIPLEPFDIRPDLVRVQADTLVITGADDFICGPAAAAAIADGIAGAEVVLIPDAGHMTFVEQPQRFRDELVAFLSR